MNRQVSPKQVALALGVSEASVKRWCDQGLMSPARTAGGHRRIEVHDVVHFARARGNPLMRADVLGLPSVSNGGDLSAARAVQETFETLQGGDETRLLQLVLNLYLNRWSALDIVERVLTPAWTKIGADWENGTVQIYEERRGIELTLAVLRDLIHVLPPHAADAPIALGATLSGESYSLPMAFGTVVLREAGIAAENFGMGLPADAICGAILKRQPRIVWLSVSTPGIATEDMLTLIARTSKTVGARFVLGGRALNANLAPKGAHTCASFTELVKCALELHPSLNTDSPLSIRGSSSDSVRIELSPDTVSHARSGKTTG